jgi:hypothetical protein
MMIGSSNSSSFSSLHSSLCNEGDARIGSSNSSGVTAFAVAAFAAANVMDGTDGSMAVPPPCLSFLLGFFCREGCDDGSGCCPALRRLRRGEVMDLMIQMKSLNCFVYDTNDTLNEFTVAVDV